MAKGIPQELWTAELLILDGWLVGSRRHIAGPGDLLAVPPAVRRQRPALIEVKATLDYPWRSRWGPVERGNLLLAGDVWDAEPLLCWWPGGRRKDGPVWLPEEDWPSDALLRVA